MKKKPALPGQVVLVLQGGGALGAYQVGVYQALHEAGIEPDWVIGTSIGAINAALICGNEPAHRLDRLHGFWAQVEQKGFGPSPLDPFGIAATLGTMSTVLRGIPSFFTPNLFALRGTKAYAPALAARTRRGRRVCGRRAVYRMLVDVPLTSIGNAGGETRRFEAAS